MHSLLAHFIIMINAPRRPFNLIYKLLENRIIATVHVDDGGTGGRGFLRSSKVNVRFTFEKMAFNGYKEML